MPTVPTATYAANTPVVNFLDNLTHGGLLTPKVEDYLNRLRTNPGFGYKAILAKHGNGKIAAEQHLAELAQKWHLHEFSGAIQSTAIGLRELAEADRKGKYTKLVRTSTNRFVFIDRRFGSDSQLLIAFNPEHNGCGCDTPEGYQIFGPNGALKLRAIILANSTREGILLGLILPNRNYEGDLDDRGFTVACLDLEGNLRQDSLSLGFSGDEYLGYSLGLMSLVEMFSERIFLVARMMSVWDSPVLPTTLQNT